jgi:hypothetical protein
MKRGYCLECNAMYEAPTVEDGLCPKCLALGPKNDPSAYDDPFPWKYSREALRERLGVSGDKDE